MLSSLLAASRSFTAWAAPFAAIFLLLLDFASSQCYVDSNNEYKDPAHLSICNGFKIEHSAKNSPYLCQSTLCYKIVPGADSPSVLSWAIRSGNSLDSSSGTKPDTPSDKESASDASRKIKFSTGHCPANDIKSSFSPRQQEDDIFSNAFVNVQNTNQAGKPLSSTQLSQCVDATGTLTMGMGELWVWLENTVCVFEVPVILKSVQCAPIDCQLDTSDTEKYCEKCPASCNPTDSTISAAQTCTFPILIKAGLNGAPCPTKTTISCTTTCSRDCLMTLEPTPSCTANIVNPTVTMTQYWKTAVAPQRLGKPCDPALSFTRYECTKNFYEKCVLDYENPKCEKCLAQCNGVDGEITSVQPCTYPTLAPGHVNGLPCPDPKFSIPCIKFCAVNCEMKLQPEIPCTRNCLKPTETFIRYWTTHIAPKNGGVDCRKDLVPETKVCSMTPQEMFLNCGGECIVDGYLTDPCAERCKKGEAPPFVATATYPITLRTNLPGYAPCPTLKTTCGCTDCVLYPVPTSISECDAKCVVGDYYAIGTRTEHYRKVQPGVGDADLTCQTKSVRLCQKECPCEYRDQSTGSCTYLKTNSDLGIWTAVGTKVVTRQGFDRRCDEITTIPCESILKPEHCAVNAVCPDCTCTNVMGPKYTISTTQRCAVKTVRTPLAGGKACPTEQPASLCYKECPGCDYPVSYCTCAFTDVIENTKFVGNPVCTYTIDDQVDSPALNGNLNCPASTKTKYLETCTSFIQPDKCAYETKTCKRCVKTRTFLDAGTYYAAGYRECTMTDLRNKAAPQNCQEPIHGTSNCIQTVPPLDCKVADYCDVCKTENRIGADSPTDFTVTCTRKILATAANGGKPCPPIENSQLKCKKPIPAPELPPSLLFPYVRPYNAIIFGNVETSAIIEGGIAICGDASLNSISVGSALAKIGDYCDSLLPTLYVSGNLLMAGVVNSGRVLAKGKCSSNNIAAKCDLDCIGNGYADANNCESAKYFDCSFISKYLAQLSTLGANLPSTTDLKVDASGLLSIAWRGTSLEILGLRNPTPDQPLKISINSFSGTLKSGATILINIDSPKVVFSGPSMRYLEPYSAYIIWNLPLTTDLEISGVQVMGSIVALNARVYGTGAVKGMLAAKSLSGNADKSVKLLFEPFRGLLSF